MPFKNILIIRTDRIGDVVLTTPAFKALRKAYPSARIAVLVSPATVDLVEGNPYIDDVIVDERAGRHKDLFGFLQLARDIRLGQFDIAFVFHTKRRYNLACFAAGVPVRVGYKDNKFGFLLTHPVVDVRHLGQKHEAQYCLDLLAAMGIEPAGLDLFVPVKREAEGWVNQLFIDHQVKPHEVIAIHPSASDASKCWPTVNFAGLIDSLAGRYALKIVLVGGKDAVGLAQEILKQSRQASLVLDLTGQTTVGQTVSLLRRSRLLISNDSGPVHVASAAGINVISLFLRNQPGINPERWKPLGPKGYVLANKKGDEIRLNKEAQVLSGKPDSITVDDVLNQVEVIFSRDAQSIFNW